MPELIAKYVEKDGQVVDADIMPAEMWTCAALTCLSLVATFSFIFGIICCMMVR